MRLVHRQQRHPLPAAQAPQPRLKPAMTVRMSSAVSDPNAAVCNAKPAMPAGTGSCCALCAAVEFYPGVTRKAYAAAHTPAAQEHFPYDCIRSLDAGVEQGCSPLCVEQLWRHEQQLGGRLRGAGDICQQGLPGRRRCRRRKRRRRDAGRPEPLHLVLHQRWAATESISALHYGKARMHCMLMAGALTQELHGFGMLEGGNGEETYR